MNERQGPRDPFNLEAAFAEAWAQWEKNNPPAESIITKVPLSKRASNLVERELSVPTLGRYYQL